MISERNGSNCIVCQHPERRWIEELLASGVYYDDVANEFAIQVHILRRHETLHSTIQSNVDPLTILRHMRWLMEKADHLANAVLNNLNDISNENLRRQLSVINTSLTVSVEYAKLVNAKKHLDPHIALPRWQQVMQKIARALKDNPEGLKALMEIMQEEGPPDAPKYFRVPVVPLGEKALETILESDKES